MQQFDQICTCTYLTATKLLKSEFARPVTYSEAKNAFSLSRSADEFASTCSSLIARMIDVCIFNFSDLLLHEVLTSGQTVPKGVKLTPVIKPQHVRLINITLDVNWDGEMTLGGYVRVSNLTKISMPSTRCSNWRAVSSGFWG